MPSRTASSSIRASGAGQGAVFLPETADRRLAGAEGLRLGVISAHHDDAAVLVVIVQRALHEAADAAILHRDVSGRADEITLPEAPFDHRLVIVLEAQMEPLELGFFEAARANDANCDRVADLLQDHARENGQDLHRDAVAILVDRLND